MSDVENYEILYRAVFEEGTVAHAYYEGPEIKILRVNNTMLRYWGKDRSVIGQSFRQALPELNDQDFPELLENVFRHGLSYTGHEMAAKLLVNGESRLAYYNFTYKPLHDLSGKTIGIYHVAIDVTEQVLARKSIEESINRVRNVVENAPFPIGVYTGENMEIVLANQSMIDVWGKGQNVIGKMYTEILPELQSSEIFQQIKRVYETGIPFRADNQLVGLNVLGVFRNFYFNYQFTPLFDTTGKIYGVMNTAADVTDLNISNQRIERIVEERTREVNEKNEALEKMNVSLQSFAFIASHDLQEPLRKIQTLSSRIKTDDTNSLSPESLEHFDRMQVSLSRMRNLINDLLEYSQTTNEVAEFELVSLADILVEVRESVLEEMERKGAVIEVGMMCSAWVIPFQIRQLLNNLIGNALKFYKKEIPPVIQVSSEIRFMDEKSDDGHKPGSKYCVLTVADNGIGFDPQYESRIFDIFHWLHNKQDYQGTGIGLAIVKKIADNHHGYIRATGMEGRGAIFTLFIPQE